MAIQTMTIGEALDKGYGDFIIGAPQAQRSEATFGETAMSIGLEVIPALIGGIGFGLAGGAGGSAVGNYLSQKYRMSRGLQDEFGLGEFGAATALGGLPVGKFADKSKSVFRGGYATPLQRTAIRAGQGAALATGELTARTFIDEDRAPTPDEVATTLLFGGVFGGTLGAAEAKFLRDGTGADIKQDMTRPQVEDAIASNIKDKGGIENASVGSPLLKQMDTTQLYTNKNLDEVAGKLLQGIENKLLQETEQVVQEIDLPDDASRLLNQVFPNLQDRNQAIENLRNAFNREEQLSKEIFPELLPDLPPPPPGFEGLPTPPVPPPLQSMPIVAKGNLADTQRLREINEQLAKLDHFGDGGQGDIAPFFIIDTSLQKLNKKDLEKLRLSKLKESRQLDSQIKTSSDELKFGKKLDKVDQELKSVELEQWRRRQEDNVKFFLKHKNKGNITIQGYTFTPDERKFEVVNDLLENIRIDAGDSEVKAAIALDVIKKHNLESLIEDGLRNKKFFYGTQVEKSDADFLLNADIKALLATHEKYFGKGKNLTQKTPSNALRKKLEKEKRALERKHNIVGNVLLGGAGVASVASMFTEEEESELRQAGLGAGMGLFLTALATKSKTSVGNLAKSFTKGRNKGKAEQEQNIVEPERIGRAAVEAGSIEATPPPQPGKPAPKKRKTKRSFTQDDVRSYYTEELFDTLRKNQDPVNTAIILEELGRRANPNTENGRILIERMRKFAQEMVEEDPSLSVQLANPEAIPPSNVPNTQGVRSLNKYQLVELARQGSQEAIDEALRRAAKNPRTKRFFQREGIITGLLTTGTGAIALMEMMEDEDSSVSRAALGGGGLLVVLAAVFGGYQFAKKFIKSAEFKKAKAQIKANPSAAEPDIIKQAKINQVLERSAFAPRNAVIEMMQSAMDFVSDALVPLSRKLKNINPALTKVFRNHERQIAIRAREYMDRVSPFIVSMNKRLKNSPQKNRLFKQYLLNGDYAKIRDDILGPNAPQALFDQLDEMTRTLDEIRDYARQRGGLDVGYIAQYFPRKIRNYTSFRRALEQQEDLGEIRTELDKALDDYAKKYGFADRDLIPPEEAAEVVSKALRTPPSGGMTPGNVKMRTIESVSPQMLDAYADPADALQDYVQRMVQATERRNFLLRKPDAGASKVGFEGSRDTINADLGMRMEVTDDMIGSLADRLRRENNLSQEDVEKLKEILRARFSSKTVSPFFQGMKNVNYMAVMGNFGSAITQLGDLAYSIHFNGFDNTFKALFNRKDNFNFVKYFGLSDSSIDAVTSTQGLSSALDKVFTVTGLKKLDQLGKNTFMNASWRKYHAQAKKNGTALVNDLAPVFGRERAGRMVRELQESDPKSNDLPKAVEELIWYKFLDVNPATLGEMPKYYNESGNMRIAYMLKSFTLKQFDVFREAGIEDIRKATKLYNEGKKGEAAKFASKGMKNLLGLAVVFAAANASTDIIKDIMYGRPIKEDDLVLDNTLKLLGINRYLMYKARREGVGKAMLETMLPPMTVFDRSSKDLDDFLSGKEYKGNLLQGTPLDIIYWRYLGGVDKVKNMD